MQHNYSSKSTLKPFEQLKIVTFNITGVLQNNSICSYHHNIFILMKARNNTEFRSTF